MHLEGVTRRICNFRCLNEELTSMPWRQHLTQGLESDQHCGKLKKKRKKKGNAPNLPEKNHLVRHNPLTPGGAAFSQSTPCSPLTTQTDAAPESPYRTMLPVRPRCSLKQPLKFSALQNVAVILPCSCAAEPQKPTLKPRKEPQGMEVRSS